MKSFIFSLVALLSLQAIDAQDLNTIFRKNTVALSKEKLSSALKISELIPDYPAGWIEKFVSAEIMVIHDGKTQSLQSGTDQLTTEQKQLLDEIPRFADVQINLKYERKNSVTNAPEMNTMHFYGAVMPEISATYPGGFSKLYDYLRENANLKILPFNAKQLKAVTAKFEIDEAGRIQNLAISVGSGDANIDNILLDAIRKMPVWIPAQDAKGNMVKQEFHYTVAIGDAGNPGGC